MSEPTRQDIYDMARAVVSERLGDRAGSPVFDDPEDFDITFDREYRNMLANVKYRNQKQIKFEDSVGLRRPRI